MKVIYLLSGLGADKRVFEFLDLSAFEIKHIEWITPSEDESIEDYADRICTQITTSNPILLGVSFGGLIAAEIAKQVACEKVILISSAGSRNDIPLYFRFIGMMRIHKLIPAGIFKRVNRITYWMFGIQSKAERSLLKEIIQSTDTKFLKWAIDKIVTWKNMDLSQNTIKIHGTIDRILPSQKADYLIEGGGHFMIVSQAIKISAILYRVITVN